MSSKRRFGDSEDEAEGGVSKETIMPCSRCGSIAIGAFTESDVWKLAPPMDTLKGKRFHNVSCFWSHICDILPGGREHPYAHAIAESWARAHGRWPQYIRKSQLPLPQRRVELPDPPPMAIASPLNTRFQLPPEEIAVPSSF
jgi:hypothetical protein